jgi:hypothetical protein
MKRFATILCATAMAAACGSDSPTTPGSTAQPNTLIFTAQLSAANEVPPITNADANARGTATITFNVTRDSAGAITGGTVAFNYSVSGFPAGSTIRAAHIHEGASGVAGGIRVDTGLTAANAVALAADGTGTITANQGSPDVATLQAIVANPASYYFNVHSALNPGGAIRGQLVRQ